MKRKQIKATVIAMSCVMSITLLGTKSSSVLAAENFRDTIVMNEGQSDSGIDLTDSIAYSAESDFYFDGNGTITGYKGTGGDVVIPNTIGGVPVTAIGPNAFSRNPNLKSISMPSVTSIEERAFFECKNLTTVNMPKVTSIGEHAFWKCANLSTVNMPEVTRIKSAAFFECKNLITVNMPKVILIENDAFSHCYGLTEIDMPEATGIGLGAFMACENLSVVNMPKVRLILDYAFYNCYNLSIINMPEVTSIGTWVFRSCYNLSTINMPEVTRIQSAAFFECKNLTTVNMPKVTSIDNGAFEDCSKLSKINISNKANIGIDTFNNTKVNSITLDYGTDEINASTQEELNALIKEWNDFVDKMKGIDKSNVTGRFVKNNKVLIDLNKEIEVPDTISPEITLNGDSIVNLEIGATYEEKGVTITDNSGETIKPVITISYNYNGTSTVVDKVDTSKVGSYTITYTAIDTSGNSSSVTRTVNVVYNYSLITKQIKSDGSSVFKANRTIPVKIQIKDSNGNYISTAIAKISLTKVTNDEIGEVNEVVETVNATSGNLFRYDEKNNHYIYNLSTKGLDKGTYELKVILDDGNAYSVQIGLR